MGKAQPLDSAEELRQLTREARETLGDLKRAMKEIDRMVDYAFEERVSACVKRSKEAVASRLDDITEAIVANSDACLEAIMNRWAYIETACVADESIGKRIALHVLKHAGGTVETESASWHLVRETTEDDGSLTFAFPRAMAGDAINDPKVEAAIQDAVRAHRPGIKLRPLSTHKKGRFDEL